MVWTYFSWLYWRYFGKDSPEGDLAGDVERVRWIVKNYPQCKPLGAAALPINPQSEEDVLEFLESWNACSEAENTARSTWKKWTIFKRRHVVNERSVDKCLVLHKK